MNLLMASAWASSACLALMIIFDRIMIGDCYRNNPKQAWFVSSLGGLTLGLVATTIAWLYVSNTSSISVAALFDTTTRLAFPYGILMLLGGIMTLQVLHFYFQAFIPEDGHKVNEAGISLWLASSPVWVFLSLVIIQAFGIQLPLLTGLEKAVVTWEFGALMILSVITLMQFEKISQDETSSWALLLKSRYLKAVLLIQLFTVGYTLVVSGILRSFNDELDVTLALLPFYFLGFGSGVVWTLLSKAAREQLYKNRRRLASFAVPILMAEIVGMMVFFLEFFALSGLDPTLVNLIIGTHVVLVFVLMWWLRALRVRMDNKGIRRYKFCGMRIKAAKIPLLPINKSKLAKELFWLLISLTTLGSCIIYIT